MEQAKQIANYLHELGNEEDADYVMFMAASIENDELHITRLVKERDELAAQVERLRGHLDLIRRESDRYDSVLFEALARTALDETPPQSLAAVRAEAQATGYEDGFREAYYMQCPDYPPGTPIVEVVQRDFNGLVASRVSDYTQSIRNGEV